MKIDLSKFVGQEVEATLQNGKKIVGVVTYKPNAGISELEYKIGPESHESFTVDGFYWSTRRPNENNIIKIEPMKKYEQLEQKVQELQKEIDRLKKEEQQNKLPDEFNLDSALSFLDDPNSGDLESMHIWSNTPQGAAYWDSIYTNLKKLSDYKVPDEAIIQIQKWVIEFYRNKQ